jgi:hypothetical protein
MKRKTSLVMKQIFLSILFATVLLNAQKNESKQTFFGVDLDTVKAQEFDMGKMWTFENPPLKYFEKEYGFVPTEEWLNKVRKSALKFATWCSASFVSEDGLVMTNHHCARENLTSVQNDGENLLRDGFFAVELNDERKMPGIHVDQLLIIEDVTDEIQKAMNSVNSSEEKIKARDEKIAEIEKRFKEQNEELIFSVTSLYNGGKYSLYGYKRYYDVRLVFAPDLRTAKLGGDYDNFTYPRYGLDCMFFRVYSEGKPLKTDYYFKWSEKGAVEDEAIFVVGNPGRTNRLNTISQIEYLRDVQYPRLVGVLKELYDVYYKRVMENNAEDFVQVSRLYSIGNSLKVYDGTLKGLNDPVLMARKKDFENSFRKAVESNNELKEQYAHIWDEIGHSRKEAAKTASELFAFNLNPFYTSEYFAIARKVVSLAEKLNQPEDKITDDLKGEKLDSAIKKIFPEIFDYGLQKSVLHVTVNLFYRVLGNEHELVKKLFNGKRGKEAVEYILNKSEINSKDAVIALFKKSPEKILNSEDPFIYFIVNTKTKLADLRKEAHERADKESLLNQLLGKAMFEVYGDLIPPDATFTLRLADGIVKSYNYNGTVAPVKTTFHGVLDRYYSFNKKFPFNLPDRWEDLPEEFDLSKPLNFISTNDIVGGNSGSPVINKNAEIVGLAFDGNIESLPNNFIYTTEANRTVSVHSAGMMEAIKHLYKAKRLATELKNGRIEN